MTVFYDILDKIKDQLELDDFVNSVSFGELDEITLQKQNIYPYAHFNVTGVTHEGSVLRFSFEILAMDIEDISPDNSTDIFLGNTNRVDILNTQLAVLTRVIDVIRRGNDMNNYQIDGNPSFEKFERRFEHGLTGWLVTFDVLTPNTMTIC